MVFPSKTTGRRVILAYWKGRRENAFEVFSNLLLFCKSYPTYSYDTMNNYLSKGKIAYENDLVRVERMKVFNRAVPMAVLQPAAFRLVREVRKSDLHAMDEKMEDLDYWLSKSPAERIAAVTFLASQSPKVGDRMDRTFVRKRKMKDHGTE
jgi:hypothetical protein